MTPNGPSPALPTGAPQEGPLAGKFVLRVGGNVVRDRKGKPVVFETREEAEAFQEAQMER